MTKVVSLPRQRLSRCPWAVVSVKRDGMRLGNWRYTRRSLQDALEHWRLLAESYPESFELWYDPHKTIVCLNGLAVGGMRRMTIQLTASELTVILAEHLDQRAIQYTVNPENITKLTTECDPEGELDSLFVYVDFNSIELEAMDDPVEKLDELRQLVTEQLYPEQKAELGTQQETSNYAPF